MYFFIIYYNNIIIKNFFKFLIYNQDIKLIQIGMRIDITYIVINLYIILNDFGTIATKKRIQRVNINKFIVLILINCVF